MTARRLFKTAEILCWCFGVALVALYFAFRADGEIERRAAISSFEAAAASVQTAPQAVAAAVTQTPSAPLTFRNPDKAQWSRGRVRAYQAAWATAGEPPGLPVAVLRIPRVHLEVPVYAEDTARNLNRGAVLIAGTSRPNTVGNTAIAAHRDGYFRALKNVSLGDILTVQTLSSTRRYRVISLHVVEPSDVSVLRRTRVPAVTLVTCYPFYFVGSAPNRYIVRALELGRSDPPAGRRAPGATPTARAAGTRAISAVLFSAKGGKGPVEAGVPRVTARGISGRPAGPCYGNNSCKGTVLSSFAGGKPR